MNDEIKEIKLLNDIANGNYKEVISKEAKNLLDYITNLQQENIKLISENEAIKNIKYTVDEVIYKSRIDNAIEYIEKEYQDNVIIVDHTDNPITPQELYGELLDILKGDSYE